MISYVIKPKTRADEDKVRGALDKILAEDRGLKQSFDAVTKEIVLSGMGANHITVATHKMERKYGVQVDLGTPTIPYRETISGKADVRYRHKKQTGGAGQFGEVSIRLSPNERGGGFSFENVTVGGVIPHSLIPSVEKGVRWQLEKGVLAGFPAVDIRVELYDGKSHPVDSKDIAFQIAGRQAAKKAVMEANPILLEPIYDVEVVSPEDNVGDIMGDMNQRRARIQNMEGRGRNSVVKAYVPLAEMLNYAPSLKSMTGGKGSYTMAFHSYEPVPSMMQDKVVEEVSRIKAGVDEE
jgi:elongation factor G